MGVGAGRRQLPADVCVRVHAFVCVHMHVRVHMCVSVHMCTRVCAWD